jgi:hypothetical protein
MPSTANSDSVITITSNIKVIPSFREVTKSILRSVAIKTTFLHNGAIGKRYVAGLC